MLDQHRKGDVPLTILTARFTWANRLGRVIRHHDGKVARVVEAADWGTLGMNDDLGYHAIAPYPLYPGFHSAPMADVAVNMNRWNGLPDDIKALVEMAVRDFSRDMVEKIALQDAQVAARAAETGVELVNWNSDERRKFRNVAVEVWADYASRSPMAQRIYDSHIAFLTRLGLLGGAE